MVGETLHQAVAQSESVDGATITRYRSLAKDLDVWLSLGGFHEKVRGPEEHLDQWTLLNGGCQLLC